LTFGHYLAAQTAQVLNFDGGNDFVVSNSNVGISGNAPRTIELWVNAVPLNEFNEHIINWGGTSPGTSFGIYQTRNSELRFYRFAAAVGEDYNTGFFFDGNWHHIAITYNGTHVRTYVDGVETPTSNQAMSLNTTDGPLYMGVREDLNSPTYSNLKMDEVRIWNRALSSFEINENKDCELQGDESGLVMYYNFNRGTPGGNNAGVTSMPDLAGSNDATLMNFTLSGGSSNWVNGSPLTNSCCEAADAPTISANKTSICAGEGVVISITNGDLKQNSDWVWYAGADINACGLGTEINAGVTSIIVTPTTTTFYSVRGEGGCAPTDGACEGIRITVKPQPVVTASTSNQNICEGASLILKATGTGDTYSWTGPNGFTSSLASPEIINPNKNQHDGYYYVTTTKNGCSAYDTIKVNLTIVPKPTINIIKENSYCAGETISIRDAGTNGSTWQWVGPNGFSSNNNPMVISNANTTNSGDYTLTVRNGLVCMTSKTFNVEVKERVTVTANTSTQNICEGGTLSLEAFGTGDSYAWEGPNGFTSSLTFPEITNPSKAQHDGVYKVTTTKNGCSASATVTVNLTISPNPTISLNNKDTYCAGETISISDKGNDGTIWKWTGPNNFSSTANPMDIPNSNTFNSGTYTLTVSNNGGCETETEFNIEVFEVETINIETDAAACTGQDLELVFSETFENIVSQNWQGPAGFNSRLTFPIIKNPTSLNSGVYNVEVTYETGCRTTATKTINFNPAANVMLSTNDPNCVGESLIVMAKGNNEGNYNWTGPNNFTSKTANFTISDLVLRNAGVYDLTYTTKTGCTTTTSFEMNLSSLPTPLLKYSGPFCAGSNELILEDESTANYNYDWENKTTGKSYTDKIVRINNPTALNSGLYEVEVTNAAGCAVIESINVDYLGSSPELEISGTKEVCTGTSINLVETGGMGQNYVWTGPNNFKAFGNSMEILQSDESHNGLYILKADNGNGCEAEAEVLIRVNASPNIVLEVNDANPCEGSDLRLGERDGELVNWNWTGPNNFSSQLPNPIISNVSLLASGTYTLKGTNKEGCEVEKNIDIKVNSSFNAGQGLSQSLCAGPIIDLKELLVGADAGGVFIDENGTGNLNNNLLSTKDLTSGTYFFTYSAANNSSCNSTTRVVIQVDELPSPSLIYPNSFCLGDTNLILSDQSNGIDYTYQWIHEPSRTVYDDKNVILPNPTEAAAGTYSVFIRNPAGCLVIDTFDISYKGAYPIVNVPETQTACVGNNISLTENGTGGQTYTWTAPNNTQFQGRTYSLENALVDDSGLYKIKVDNGNGCSVDGAILLTVHDNPEILISSSDTVVCSGTNLTLNQTGDVLTNWTWNGPNNFIATTQNPSLNSIGLASKGIYTLVGQDINGCEAIDSIELEVKQSFNAGSSRDLQVCQGTEVDLSILLEGGDRGGLFFDEQGVALTDSILPTTELTEGDYVFSYTLAENSTCISSTSFFIRVREQLTAGEDINLSHCQNELLDLQQVLSDDASGGGLFLETTQSGGLSGDKFNGSNLKPDTYQIIYRVGEGSVCPLDEALITLKLNPIPAKPEFNDTNICEGESINLEATDGISYLWSNGDTTQNIRVTPLATSDYGVIVRNEFNCINEGAAMVIVNPLPVVSIMADTVICEGEAITLHASGAISYNWNPSIGLENAQTASPLARPIENITYEVEGKNEAGCISKEEISITVNKKPALKISEGVIFCEGVGSQISAEGVGSIEWSPTQGLDNPSSKTPFANPTETTNYQALLKDEHGCVDTGWVLVEVKELPIPDLGEDQTICKGDNIELIASGGGNYLWDSADTLSDPTNAVQLIQPFATTSYEVKVVGENSCEARDTINILVNESPMADAGPDQTTCAGVSVNLIGSGGEIYEWNNGTTSPVNTVSPEESTTYTLKVTNEFGCTDTDKVAVMLTPEFDVQISGDTFYCIGDSTILSASGGVSYEWSPAIGLNNTQIPNPIASPITTTDYEVIIKDEEGCIVKRQVTLEVKNVERFSITDDQDVCEGKKILLEAEGGISYNWSPVQAFDDPKAAFQEILPTENSTYKVEVMDEFGCRKIDSVMVTIRQNPMVNIHSAEQLCAGDTLTLFGMGTDIKTWKWEGNNFSSTEQNPQIIGISTEQSGQFKLIGTTDYGCENRDSIVIQVHEQPIITIETKEKICENSPFILTSSSDNIGLNINWTSVDGTTFNGAIWDLGPAKVPFSGNYRIEVMDEKGCRNQVEKEIVVITAPNPGMDTAVSTCQGTIVDIGSLLRGTNEKGVFELGAGLPDLENNLLNTAETTEGTYGIGYRVEKEGCPDGVAELILKIELPKKAGLDNSATICQGVTVELNDLLQEADIGGIYQTDANEAALVGNLWQSANLIPNDYTIHYIQANACGMDQATFQIKLLEQVDAGEDVQTNLCPTGDIDLITLLLEANPQGIFQDLSATNALEGSLFATNDVDKGVYKFSYLVESENECPSDSAFLELTLNDSLNAGLDNFEQFCAGNFIKLSDLLLDADAGGIFTPLGISPPNLEGETFESTDLGGNQFEFEYKIGGEGCPEDKAMIAVRIDESPTLTLIVPDSFICLGDSVLLEVETEGGTGNLNFEWTTPTEALNANHLYAKEAGEYVVQIEDENGCKDLERVSIASNELVHIEIEGRTNLCQNEDLILQPLEIDANLKYNWQLPNGVEVKEALLVLPATQVISGNYELQYTDQLNCSNSVQTMISLSPGEYFKSNFLTANLACTGDSLHFIEISEVVLSPNATYRWDFGDGVSSSERDPIHSFQNAGLFPVRVEIEDQDCQSISIEKEVNIVLCRKNIFDNSPFDYLNIYPNPTDRVSTLTFDLNRNEPVRIEVFDAYGKRVLDRIIQNQRIYEESIILRNSGVYFIHLYTSSAKKILKLIVQE
jgi:hypothetical protein